MKRKNNRVSFDGIHPGLVPYLFIIDEVYRDYLGHEVVITSCTDGKHSATSRHYLGTAVDVRTWTTPVSGTQLGTTKRLGLFNALKKALGEDFLSM